MITACEVQFRIFHCKVDHGRSWAEFCFGFLHILLPTVFIQTTISIDTERLIKTVLVKERLSHVSVIRYARFTLLINTA